MNTLVGRSGCWLALLAALSAACAASKEKLLEDVAKDWCMAIRASQVMPVYPLTQDVQPGDVFLVRLSIDKQQEAWSAKGYLSLDNHLARLDPDGYGKFYQNSFPPGSTPSLPLSHLMSTPPWSKAPNAGFPTYSFSVQKGGGMNLALPVSGVPIGLGLLGADAAEGSVSIGKARTLGIDIVSLDRQLRAWSAEGDNHRFLAGLASTSADKNYVRVVTRVYLTGELDVSLRDTSQRSAGVDVGVPSPVAMLLPKVAPATAATPAAAASDYTQAIDQLNKMLQSQDRFMTNDQGVKTLMPGGSLRLTSATARAISMKETFDPPLVIGYLGFDCEIGPGGALGPAVPTYAVVSGELGGEAFVASTPAASAWLDQLWVSSYQVAKARATPDPDAGRVVDQCDALGRFVPPTWEVWQLRPDGVLLESNHAGNASTQGTYELFRQWRGNLASSSKDLAESLAKDSFAFERAGESIEVKKDSAEAATLASRLAAVRAQLDSEPIETAHAQARRALADWMFANLYATRSK